MNKQTTQLCVEIFQLELPETLKNKKKLTVEIEKLYELSENVPRLISESYGDKFTDLTGALQKLEKAAQTISNIITKIDFIVASVEPQELKETLNKILKRYQTQRVKILNLKRAWDRVFNKHPSPSFATHKVTFNGKETKKNEISETDPE